MSDIVEKVAKAIDGIHESYSIKLASLVNDVSVYTLDYMGERHEFPSHYDASEYMSAIKSKSRARAAIKATIQHLMENVSEGMQHAGGCSLEHPTVRMEGPSIHSIRNAKRTLEAMLSQALSELEGK